MDIKTAIGKMEEMLHLMDEYLTKREEFGQEKWDRITELYGQVEETIHQVDGTQVIMVESLDGRPTVHKDLVSAGWLSGRTFHLSEGRTQVVKLIAKLRAMIGDPGELDDLVPLYRRRMFDVELATMVEVARKANEPLSLLMIDLDRFKAVNDQQGHSVGDEVLFAVAQMVGKRARGKGKAYRYGGEEMSVLLPNYSVDEATALAERMRRDVEEARVSRRNLEVTVSIGVASLPDHASNPRSLLEKADAALYDAKDLGRNLVRVSGEPRATERAAPKAIRREPEPGGLRERQLEDIRLEYYRNREARCPNDQALLRVIEARRMGDLTPDLRILCSVCGLDEQLPGQRL